MSQEQITRSPEKHEEGNQELSHELGAKAVEKVISDEDFAELLDHIDEVLSENDSADEQQTAEEIVNSFIQHGGQ